MKSKLFKIKFIIPVLMAIVLSSCYYDYVLSTDNYDVVATFYNKDYNFGQVNKYYMADSIKLLSGSSLNVQYQNTIYTVTESNLNSLGWTRVSNRDSADVVVAFGAFETTVVYNTGGSCYWDYYGYYWCDPYYYSTYTYETGTIVIGIGDLRGVTSGTTPVKWTGILNGLTGQSGTQARIEKAINQAFSQSSYLR